MNGPFRSGAPILHLRPGVAAPPTGAATGSPRGAVGSQGGCKVTKTLPKTVGLLVSGGPRPVHPEPSDPLASKWEPLFRV